MAAQDKNEDAISYLLRALEINNTIGNNDESQRNYFGLYGIYSKMKNYEKALEYHVQYTRLKDSLLNSASAQTIADMQNDLQLEMQRIEEERRREKEEEEHHRAEQMQYLAIITMIVIAFAFLFIAIKIRLSFRTIDMIVFVGVLLFFEFLHVVLHPYINEYTHGHPILFMAVNIAIASSLKPLHHSLEHRLKAYTHRNDKRKAAPASDEAAKH